MKQSFKWKILLILSIGLFSIFQSREQLYINADIRAGSWSQISVCHQQLDYNQEGLLAARSIHQCGIAYNVLAIKSTFEKLTTVLPIKLPKFFYHEHTVKPSLFKHD